MDALVIDATHGGVKLAIEFSKLGKYESVFLYDIYNTLKEEEIARLHLKGVEIVSLEEVKSDSLLVIYPVHLPLTREEMADRISAERLEFATHHEGVRILLESFFNSHDDIAKIEITGVKGKTSSAFMLKEILKDLNPLMLSSLGIIQSRDPKDIVLKKNVSITPANIKEAVDLAYRIDNPACNLGCRKTEPTDNVNYKSLIVECSLGASGIGDVGLLTNIVENYPIAKGRSDAKVAKSQVFKCGKVAIQKECLDRFYKRESEELGDKINTFSIDDEKSNVYCEDIDYNITKTRMRVVYSDVKTVKGNIISGEFHVESFAIGPHHIKNILGVIAVALTLEIPESRIIEGLGNYEGIEGRTHIREEEGLKIIEEINPGINTKAIELSIGMLDSPEDYCIIIGGDYGITCEEIDEDKVAELLEERDSLNLILTGAVGKSIGERLSRPAAFIESHEEAVRHALDERRNILFIYRSDYRKLSQR